MITALFISTNLEWNYFDLFTKIFPYDKYISITVIALFLVLNAKITKYQAVFSTIWISLFFFYWTFDVKGYFKGYETYYGSMVLLVGFIDVVIILKYIKYIIKNRQSAVSREKTNVLSKLDFPACIIDFIELFMVIWAYNIMSWYQSKTAIFLMLLFVAMTLIPEPFHLIYTRIMLAFKKEKRQLNYFCFITLCAIITNLAMFAAAYLKGGFTVLSSPFIINFLCTAALFRYFHDTAPLNNYIIPNIDKHTAYVKENFKQNGILSAISVLTILMPVAILAPLENYYTNIRDFIFACSDFFTGYLAVSIFITVVITLIGCTLRASSLKAMCTAMFSLGITTYIQVMFLNRTMSAGNGSAFDFSTLGNYIKINFAIWLSILVLICIISFLLRDKWKYMIFYIGGLVCLVQLVASISLPLTYRIKDRTVTYELSAKDEFEVAANENIIVFILDSIGNIQLENAMNEFPSILDGLNDFTFYENADCTYAWTYPSLTHMLTGSDVDFDAENSFEWQNKAWNDKKVISYYDMLHNAGYSVNLYTNDLFYTFGNGENLSGKFDNVHEYRHIVNKKELYEKMLYFALYKTLPYAFKEKFQVLTDDFAPLVTVVHDGDDAVSTQDLFYFRDELEKGLSINDSTQKAIRIIHLCGSHEPFAIDENLKKIENATRNQAVYANITLVKMYIDELKNLGLYDNAAIIIMSDHGTFLKVTDPQPILFVKEQNASSDEMKISNAPVSHNDFMASLLYLAGLDYKEYGKCYSDFKEDDIRERTTGYLSYDRKYYSFYTYTGDRSELLKKFPDNPDYSMKALE